MLVVNGKPISLNGKLFEYNEEPVLPPYTIRLKYKQGSAPRFEKGTAVLVDATNKIYDLTYENSNWENLLVNHVDLLEVINANTTNVENMQAMFFFCNSLTTIPLFDTSKVTKMDWMFMWCYKVQSGALALYQQASTQANPPTSHEATFRDCGQYTQTGAAELAQIPDDWK